MDSIPLEKRINEILNKKIKDIIGDTRLFRLEYNNRVWHILYFNKIVLDYYLLPRFYNTYIIPSNQYFNLINELYGLENVYIKEILPTTRW